MTREETIAACMTFSDAYEDYPFDDLNWTVMRHTANQRSFAMIFSHEGRIWMNLKCEPLRGDFLKSVFPSVVPAYHMNKTHWISVILDGSIADEDIQMMLQESHRLTANARK